MACDDRYNHLPPWAATTPQNQQNVPAPLPCRPDTANSCNSKKHRRDFTVCVRCRNHTREMLGLQQNPLPVHDTPFNHDRLVQTPLLWIPGFPAAVQSGRSPRPPPGGFVPGGPGVAASPGWWHLNLAERMGTVTAGGLRTDPPFEGFLTRLCTNCEELVLHEAFFHQTNQLVRDAPLSVVRLWEDANLCTCTCRKKLGADEYPGEETLCKEHCEEQWNNLVELKNRRDRWLRRVQINPRNGRLMEATVATKRNRVNMDGWWRACRCGNEIAHVHGQPYRALLCMGCEGHVVVDPFPPGPAAPLWSRQQYLAALAAAGDLHIPRRPLHLGGS